jgi:imidazole glycerol-phosphate synthase subunit HisH
MRVTLLDLGVGNLHSLEKAFAKALEGATVDIATEGALSADLVVLPGVGAFAHAAERLGPSREVLLERAREGRPIVGICLGMQLLFDVSEEGPGRGLGLIPGRVTKLATSRCPHMGFSTLEARAVGLELPSSVYYAHSYACRPDDPSSVLATSTLEGDTFPAIVKTGRTLGFQFHPEKSSIEGLALLRTLAGGMLT